MSKSKYKYLKHIPKPFLDDIVASKCIPFVGAGLSRNAELDSGESMPLWDDLGKSFANDILDFTHYNPVDSISAYEHEYSRSKLVEKLVKDLHIESSRPGAAHLAFCDLPFDTVCTTNFDLLIELGYQSVKRYCHTIVEEEGLAIATSKKATKLIKFHGDIQHPNNLIVTENDYDKFVELNPMMSTFISNLLITRSALFIGYSLEDPDFRNLWSIISERLGKLRRQGYTVLVDAKPHQISRFERRDVKVINLPGKKSEYSKILTELFKELKEYWESEVVSQSVVTVSDTELALKSPIESSNRLCYFTVPFNLYSFYREEVFPIVKKYGLSPVMSTDLITKDESILVLTEALINRSEFIVADVSTTNTIFELGMITSKSENKAGVVIIVEEGASLPIDMTGYRIISRPAEVSVNRDMFFTNLINWLGQISDSNKDDWFAQPRQLLEQGLYSEAVFYSLRLVDFKLRELLKDQAKTKRLTISGLINLASNEGLVEKVPNEKLKEWVYLRNNMAHNAISVNKKQSEKVVNEIYEFLKQIENVT